MNFVEEHILKDGVVKEGNVLKVDSFLNHKMDVAFLDAVGKEFYRRFADLNITALRLALGHLPRTMVLGGVNAAAGWLCLRFMLPVMVLPGIAGLLSAFLLEPVFKTYETCENT